METQIKIAIRNREYLTAVLDRNIPNFRGKGLLIAGYPKTNGVRRYPYSIHSQINFRAIMARCKKALANIMKNNTPEQILEKMNQSKNR